MRSSFSAMAGLILLSATSVLQAQAPGGPPQQPGQTAPTQPATQQGISVEQKKILDSVLASWETDAKNLQSLYVQFLIEEKEPAFPKSHPSYGEAKVLKMPNGQYGLKLETFELDRNGNPDRTKIKEKYVCSGMWFYQFDVGTKTINFRKLENQNMKPDDGPFAFLFGMKATETWKRFKLSIVQQDKDYTWILCEPLTPQDQKDFRKALLGVINYANTVTPKDFPLRISWQEPGNKEITWNFKAVVRNDLTKVAMSDFTVENEKKAGWKLRESTTMGTGTTGPATGVPTSGGPRK